jgi:V/A-type H+-transporting ATPase subunit D
MAKIRLTKNELKTQRDALKRFTRFLPTLELKKKQLIQEIKKIEDSVAELDQRIDAEEAKIERYAKMLSEDVGLLGLVDLKEVITKEGNIAGVPIPVFVEAKVQMADYDLYSMPLWVDSAVLQISELARIRAERGVLEEQLELLRHELKVTIQRVNLFEKIKIPECKNNIRRIQIYLGDQQTNAVVRGKISKVKLSREEAV